MAATASSLVSGVASITIVSVFVIAVLIDGENLIGRIRRLLPHQRRQQADEVGRVAPSAGTSAVLSPSPC